MIEIGAGAGEFVRRMCDEGWTTPDQLLCTELSDESISRIRKRGIQCLKCGVLDLKQKAYEHRFEALCMFQVLEHMDNIEEVFHVLEWISAPHARLFIGVPNAVQRVYYDGLGIREDVPPIHLTRWNRKSLELIGSRTGWILADWQVEEINPAKVVLSLLRSFWAGQPISERVASIRNSILRKPLIACGFAWVVVTRFSALLDAAVRKDMGRAQWAHFVRAR